MQKIPARIARFAQRHRAALQWLAVALMAAAIIVLGRFKGPIKEMNLCRSAGEQGAYLLLFGLLFAAVLGYFTARKKPDWPHFLYVAGIVLVALYVRFTQMNQVSGDYADYLSHWVQTFREHGFGAVAMEIGDYNLPYQYILAGIAALPASDLYLIKLVSIVFDLALAVMAMELVERFAHRRFAIPALTALLLIPTGWFNSAYWAQCDSLYALCILACLYAMLVDRPVWSVALLTVAFSFKIQTVFFFPMVLFGLLHGKYKLRHAWVFPAVYLLLLLPALLAGRGLVSALTIYARQTAQYSYRLTMNAPNIYQFLPSGMVGNRPEWFAVLRYIPGVDPEIWSEWFTLKSISRLLSALVPFAGALVASLLFYLYKRRKYIALEQVWRLSLLSVLVLPLVLPKMHDRYFYLADVFAVLYALRYPKRWYVPVLVAGASFASYMPYLTTEKPIDLRIAALMMLAAAVIVWLDLAHALREARAADRERPPEAETYVI